MSIPGVNISSAAAPMPNSRLSGGVYTSAALGESFVTALRTAQKDDQTTMQEAAEKLVTDAFVKPALASMRESPFRDGLFAPGPGERRFMPMLDELIADRITKAANFSLVEAVTRHISNIVGIAPTDPQREASGSEVGHG